MAETNPIYSFPLLLIVAVGAFLLSLISIVSSAYVCFTSKVKRTKGVESSPPPSPKEGKEKRGGWVPLELGASIREAFQENPLFNLTWRAFGTWLFFIPLNACENVYLGALLGGLVHIGWNLLSWLLGLNPLGKKKGGKKKKIPPFVTEDFSDPSFPPTMNVTDRIIETWRKLVLMEGKYIMIPPTINELAMSSNSSEEEVETTLRQNPGELWLWPSDLKEPSKDMIRLLVIFLNGYLDMNGKGGDEEKERMRSILGITLFEARGIIGNERWAANTLLKEWATIEAIKQHPKFPNSSRLYKDAQYLLRTLGLTPIFNVWYALKEDTEKEKHKNRKELVLHLPPTRSQFVREFKAIAKMEKEKYPAFQNLEEMELDQWIDEAVHEEMVWFLPDSLLPMHLNFSFLLACMVELMEIVDSTSEHEHRQYQEVDFTSFLNILRSRKLSLLNRQRAFDTEPSSPQIQMTIEENALKIQTFINQVKFHNYGKKVFNLLFSLSLLSVKEVGTIRLLSSF